MFWTFYGNIPLLEVGLEEICEWWKTFKLLWNPKGNRQSRFSILLWQITLIRIPTAFTWREVSVKTCRGSINIQRRRGLLLLLLLLFIQAIIWLHGTVIVYTHMQIYIVIKYKWASQMVMKCISQMELVYNVWQHEYHRWKHIFKCNWWKYIYNITVGTV